jgi:hypothetical protein
VDCRDFADIAASGQYRLADRERREKGSSTINAVSGDPGAFSPAPIKSGATATD